MTSLLASCGGSFLMVSAVLALTVLALLLGCYLFL